MPPDPFAGDPSDPSHEFDEVDPVEPLDDAERVAVTEDLADLSEFEHTLAPLGYRGVAVHCDDCQEEHFHDWAMLRASLEQLLRDGLMLPHEPAFDPLPEEYLSWEYCRGYVDALRTVSRSRWRRF